MSAETRKKIAENELIDLMAVPCGLATVPYKGNDKWAGIKGKVLDGHDAALRYAAKIDILIRKNSCEI